MMAQAVECPKVGECYLIGALSNCASIARIDRIVSVGPKWEVYISCINPMNCGLTSMYLRQANAESYPLFKKVEAEMYDKAAKVRDVCRNTLTAMVVSGL